VISLYKGQARLLERVLSGAGGTKPRIVTVDRAQGSEADHVILSCVRSNARRSEAIGFAKDRRRLNVAISRSKKTLTVLGNPTTMGALSCCELISNRYPVAFGHPAASPGSTDPWIDAQIGSMDRWMEALFWGSVAPL
jgi:hypothetical protein